MKKAILAIMVLGLCFGLANAAMAVNTDSTTVTVEVEGVEDLVAPEDVTITMDYTTGDTNYDSAITPETSQITYVHNSDTNKKITASATGEYSDTDIDITVKVADGVTEPGPIVTGGVGQIDVLLWDEIEHGDYTKTVTWEAEATIADTPAGTYGFTVTFTATDVE